MESVNIFWFRRDLRLEDNTGLYHALQQGLPVVPIFIYDRNILDKLPSRSDRRVTFIYEFLVKLNEQLIHAGSSLQVFHGYPEKIFDELCDRYNIHSVYANHDYEKYPIERDEKIKQQLASKKISFISCKDHVLFEKDEVIKKDGKPYTVFTPYSRVWRSKLDDHLQLFASEKNLQHFIQSRPAKVPSPGDIGFEYADGNFPPAEIDKRLIKQYDKTRDIPAIEGTSRLGVHLRFGTISIRKLARTALDLNETFLNELAWRDFFQSITWHFPHVCDHKPFHEEYENIQWRNNEEEFERWCKGTTGYPLVDAGMRQLNATGFMHNRVRMVVASFLSKHLLIDWRWGEAYFADMLLDYEFASNNGGWQWAAGCGCDAAPYFRIFNPALQTKRFDPEMKYIKQWVPEFGTEAYPLPIVEHSFARERCLQVYKKALSGRSLG